MAELRPFLDRIDREAGGVDHRLGLVGVDRADRVDDRAAGPSALGRRAEEVELKLGERRRAPAQVGPRSEDSQARARRVDEGPVEAGQLRRQREPVGVDDAHVRGAEPGDVLLELACPRLVHLDGRHVAREHRRLPAGRSAEIEHALPLLRADDEAGELRAAALRPDPALGEGACSSTRSTA